MKKFKKALAVLLAGVLALAMLTACGGGADGGKEPQHVTGAFNDTSKVTIGKVEVSSCTVEAYSMAQSPEKYKGYEYIGVSFGVRNQSEAPLDLERSASEWFQVSSASATDFDAAYDGLGAGERCYDHGKPEIWQHSADRAGPGGLDQSGCDLCTVQCKW